MAGALARSLQGPGQAKHRQALDEGADPRRLVLRDPEEEVSSTGDKEGAQPQAQARLLWETRGSASSQGAGAPQPGLRSGSLYPSHDPQGAQQPESRTPNSRRLLGFPSTQAQTSPTPGVSHLG